MFNENFNDDFRDNTVLFAQQRSQLGHKQVTNALKISYLATSLSRVFTIRCVLYSLQQCQLFVNSPILVRKNIPWKLTWMWSYLWELAFENVHERDPEKDDCVLYVSQFSAGKSSPKIPILCWRINRKKKTEFSGWASRIFSNAISSKSYFNLKIYGS